MMTSRCDSSLCFRDVNTRVNKRISERLEPSVVDADPCHFIQLLVRFQRMLTERHLTYQAVLADGDLGSGCIVEVEVLGKVARASRTLHLNNATSNS